MDKAMNLTYGDFIILEIALISYLKDLDLSMQSGQYISQLLGKLEYNLANIQQGVDQSAVVPVNPPPGPPAPHLKP